MAAKKRKKKSKKKRKLAKRPNQSRGKRTLFGIGARGKQRPRQGSAPYPENANSTYHHDGPPGPCGP